MGLGCVAVIAPKEAGAGKMEIVIDGQTRATADLSTNGARQSQQVVCEVTGLTPGTTYYFCNTGCKDSFVKDPEKYLAKAKAEGAMAGEMGQMGQKMQMGGQMGMMKHEGMAGCPMMGGAMAMGGQMGHMGMMQRRGMMAPGMRR